ncbi:MAG: ribosomal protein S18-alanine N-acetyltransferase [Bacilli bacterium]|nr:ribosomal protein S18-alanine N-acetyltransferase [Bacilli bacterium]
MIREVDIIHTNPFARKIEYIEDSKSIGYLEYSLIYDRMEIDNFMVLEEYRNKGIGTKLLAHLISLAINYRVINITLEVRVSNEVAISLYKKFGFREVALRKYYYGDEDGILMEKQVM